MWRWLLVALAACGRVAFDPQTDAMSDPADPTLLLHYRFDDNPGDGVLDASGNGHTGVCTPTCPSLHVFNAARMYIFSGTQLIETADTPKLRPTTLTAAVWYWRPVSNPEDEGVLQKLYGAGAGTLNSWQLMVLPDGGVYICTTATTSGGRCDRSAPVIANRTWHHVAYVQTGTRHRAFVDGNMVIDQIAPMIYDDSPILVGADIDFGQLLTGTQSALDDVRIYDRALDANELAALAASPPAGAPGI